MDHLDENEIAQYVDAQMLDTQNQLPAEMLEHVEDCFECKVEIMEVIELMECLLISGKQTSAQC